MKQFQIFVGEQEWNYHPSHSCVFWLTRAGLAHCSSEGTSVTHGSKRSYATENKIQLVFFNLKAVALHLTWTLVLKNTTIFFIRHFHSGCHFSNSVSLAYCFCCCHLGHAGVSGSLSGPKVQVQVIPEFKFCCIHAALCLEKLASFRMVQRAPSGCISDLAFQFKCFNYIVAQINKLYLLMKPWKTNQGKKLPFQLKAFLFSFTD